MKKTNSLFPELTQKKLALETVEEPAVNALSILMDSSEELFIKKMSLNDWEWTIKKNKHQNGPLIPKEQRDSDFFPARALLDREPGKAEIWLARFDIVWPQTGEVKLASLRYFTSKNEAHLTGVPSYLFSEIAPASFIVIGKNTKDSAEHASYLAVVIDSESEEADALVDMFSLGPKFQSGLFIPAIAVRSYQDKVFDFVDQALAAFKAGNLDTFARNHASLPEPNEIALMAQREYQKRVGKLTNFDPFLMSTPGDCLLEISRGIELEIFREYELRQRSLELVKVILGSSPNGNSIESVFRNIIQNFPLIDKILLSASQTRKSRAGRSFEFHIQTMLEDGKVPHEVQVVMASKRRPDFILPSFDLYNRRGREHKHALVLSAKTTLRERWKQVEGEIKDCDLYLATVDDKIAENAIQSMQASGIKLVVPESLKKSEITTYKNQENVISFKEFFHRHLKDDRYPDWRSMGIII
ncbi:hypothetical protein FHW67_003401 [Herbaspirillum sp. Sphag1AN]|uniref:type II restriction endonuclease n=1 Tax=unclassified Herbaspirillum TaxID=2624150 RepID=UPI001620EE07|nr:MULTISPECIES: type II restriction endonuclease [unclassified Herbaspirillum]MBB3214091.1 hypothetical protein [Herbaspirillum sp. Sphag1AN]MBB3247822.1 hypothetical protein [Herbaspirillum sp. Sphag64]